MRKRIQTVRDNGLPWLVALWRGAIVGYCYATFYRPRPAYRYTLEESIYVESGMGGRGIGSALLSRLIAECEKGPWRQMLAIIGDGHNNAARWRSIKVRLYRGGSAAQRRLQDGRLAGYVDYAARAG